MNLSQRLKEERERLGYSQTAFAAIAHASKHAQINWEKGEATPNAAALAAWSKTGLDVLYVVLGERNTAEGSLQPREKALLDNYKNSGKEGQRAIERVAMLEAKQPEIELKKTFRKAA